MTLVWLEGEQAAYAGKPGRLAGAAAERALELLLGELDKKQPLRASEIARLGDEKLAELAAELGPTTCDVATMKLLLGRLGDAFVEQAVSLVRTSPRELFEGAMPIESADLVKSAAAVLFERDVPGDEAAHYAPSAAESWLLRHASFAADVLTPLAQRGIADACGCALAFLAAHGKVARPAWLAPFAELASRVATSPSLALRAARGKLESPHESRPAFAPLPAFFDPLKLPRPVLKEGGAPLSDEDVRALGDFLRSSSLLHPHAELAKLRFRCERASLDAFVTGLLAAWCEAGTPELRPWPLEACGTLGGDEAARAVATRVRAWTRTRGYLHDEFAKVGCSVLAVQAQHGSELARVLLDEIARTGGRARKEASRLAGVVDVTSQEEAKIPTLGLDASGSLALDLGTETYRIVFDEALAPHLVDGSGARVAAFPRLRKGMDAKAWERAKEIHAGIVKDAKVIARHELAMLERRMCTEEAQPLASFRERYVEHPLLRHLGKRLVWSSGATFRVTEDGTFADAEDKTFSPRAEVTLAHPVLMTEDERRAWIERFADYEILQPFEQLARMTFTDAGGSPRTIDALPSGTMTTRGRIFQLVARGWELKYDRIERALEGGATVSVGFTGPIGAWSNEYTVASATSADAFALSPIEYSELMRDLVYLAGRA